MKFEIIEEGKFQFIDEGQGEVLLLLHGLFGALSNFSDLVETFRDRYRVIIPILPLYTLSVPRTGLPGLVAHVQKFVEFKKLKGISLMGNSLGGHISLLFAEKNLDKLASITLTGSSGLFENSLGSTFPKRGNYDFIKEKTEYTFYDPKMATKELVDEVFEIVNNRNKALRVILTAKSALRHNLADKLPHIDVPTLLIWGKNDHITPPFVGEEFHKLLPNSELHFIDKCGHAPMMERPGAFNDLLANFLERVYAPA